MLHDVFKKRTTYKICNALLIFFIFAIFAIMIIIIYGLDDFIDDFLEFFSFHKRETWVLLVAGSQGWSNYRHQADIAHAYHMLLTNGIPVNRIIVMMVDDVAYHPKNPFPGEIFNHPNGSDVYQGLQIDYTGDAVSSKNFLRVLTGNKADMKTFGSGRVIESKRKDNIFVNFVGHGASGILAFPDLYLYADELNIALQWMYDKNTFKKLLLYIESCKSGSLFDGILSEYQNIFAITASGPRESSWAIYCTENNEMPCLGDEFSVTWIEDQSNVNHLIHRERTIFNQFNYIRSNVKLSNVMLYGDFRVGKVQLSEFIGESQEIYKKHTNNTPSSMKNNYLKMNKHSEKNSKWKLFNYNNLMRQNLDKILDAILQEIVKQWPTTITDIDEFKEIPDDLPLNIFPCYRQTLNCIIKNCFSSPKNTYFLKKVHLFFNLCTRITKSTDSVEFDTVFEKVVRNICSHNISSSSFRKITDFY